MSAQTYAAGAVVAHAELTAGLPESKVGLVPGWGGCTQLLLRASANGTGPKGPAGIASVVFDAVLPGTVSGSAREAMAMGLLRQDDGIVMHRDQLLPAAKARAAAMVAEHRPPEPVLLTVAGPSGRLGLLGAVSAAVQAGRMTPTDAGIATALAAVLTGGAEGDPTRSITEAAMIALELNAMIELVDQPTTRARMDHMQKTGKPLRN